MAYHGVVFLVVGEEEEKEVVLLEEDGVLDEGLRRREGGREGGRGCSSTKGWGRKGGREGE